MIITFVGCKPYLMNTSNWSLATQGFYGSFAYTTFAVGFSMLLMPAILGKAQFIRFFFGGGLWTPFPNMGYGIYMCNSMVCMYYFLSISNSLHVDYQMYFYYFCGNFVFTTLFVNILYVFVDRPFSSMIKISEDCEAAYVSRAFKIEKFKVGIVLGGNNRGNNLYDDSIVLNQKAEDDVDYFKYEQQKNKAGGQSDIFNISN